MARTLVLLAAVAFGTTGTARALGPDASPVAVGAARVAVGAVLLALVAWRTAPRSQVPWSRPALFAGALGIAAYQLAFFAAVARHRCGGRHRRGDRVGARLRRAARPRAADRALGRSRRHWPRPASPPCWWRAAARPAVSIPGVLLALVAGASYGTYTVAANGAASTRVHAPEAVMARAFTAAAVLLAPALLFAGTGWMASPGGAALALYLGAIPTAAGLRALRPRAAPHLRGRGGDAEPRRAAHATALGTVVLGERPGALAVLGALLVLSGLVALAVPARRRQALAAA